MATKSVLGEGMDDITDGPIDEAEVDAKIGLWQGIKNKLTAKRDAEAKEKQRIADEIVAEANRVKAKLHEDAVILQLTAEAHKAGGQIDALFHAEIGDADLTPKQVKGLLILALSNYGNYTALDHSPMNYLHERKQMVIKGVLRGE